MRLGRDQSEMFDDDDFPSEEARRKFREERGDFLPELITAPGYFLTRGGLTAMVMSIKFNSADFYTCYGKIFASGKEGPGENASWHKNGRWKETGPNIRDLVERIK